MIEIDGSFGEGGGQILRSALTLSMGAETPFRIFNIRANRDKPGLRPQHLQCVRAAAQICGAEVKGAAVGSSEISFRPGEISLPESGEYHFDIGTAGATSLVLQTVFLPLALAPARSQSDDSLGTSEVTITGGTHVPFSPCFHYLDIQWLKYLRQIGFKASLELKRAGYFPAGGGEIMATISNADQNGLRPLEVLARGNLKSLSGISVVSNLPSSIAERQKKQAEKRLRGLGYDPKIQLAQIDSVGKGTMLFLRGEFDNSQACYFALGAIGKRAEQVANEACNGFYDFAKTDAAIEERLADQLLLPLSFADGASLYTTSKVTQHLLTNAEVIRKFLKIEISIEGDLGECGLVTVSP